MRWLRRLRQFQRELQEAKASGDADAERRATAHLNLAKRKLEEQNIDWTEWMHPRGRAGKFVRGSGSSRSSTSTGPRAPKVPLPGFQQPEVEKRDRQVTGGNVANPAVFGGPPRASDMGGALVTDVRDAYGYGPKGERGRDLKYKGTEVRVDDPDDLDIVGDAIYAIGPYNDFDPAEVADRLAEVADVDGLDGIRVAREGSPAIYVRPTGQGSGQWIISRLGKPSEVRRLGLQPESEEWAERFGADEVDEQPDGTIRFWWD